MKLLEDQIYNSSDFTATQFEIAHYEACSFNSIDFKGSTFSGAKFVDCEFTDCDLSMVNLTEGLLQNVSFTRCKMLGLFFETVKPFLFEVRFKECNLENSSFVCVAAEKTVFDDCKLVGVDFTDANLSEVQFLDGDLKGATFCNTNLVKADLRIAQNFSIEPQLNQTKNALVDSANLAGFVRHLGLDIRI